MSDITTLSTTLDSSSACATGAACYGAGLSGIEIDDVAAAADGGEAAPGCGEEAVAALTAKLGEILAQTDAQVQLAAARSEFESCIYDWRNRLDTDKVSVVFQRPLSAVRLYRPAVAEQRGLT